METFEDMIEQANIAIRKATSESAIYIGCDSQRFKKGSKFYAKYSTVIILHKEQKHGGKLFRSLDVREDYGNIKQRLLAEAGDSIRAFEGVVDACLEMDISVHIHLDLNADPKHKSNAAVKEACGWVLGSTGVVPDIKPLAWAASSAADHDVRGKFHTGVLH